MAIEALSNSNPSGEEIASIVIGSLDALVFIVIIILLVYFFSMKRPAKKEQDESEILSHTNSSADMAEEGNPMYLMIEENAYVEKAIQASVHSFKIDLTETQECIIDFDSEDDSINDIALPMV